MESLVGTYVTDIIKRGVCLMEYLLKEDSLPAELRFGLGWDVARGLLPKLDVDLDAFAALMQDGKFVDKRDLIHFSRLKHYSDCLKHFGDNNSGYGAGDDERILIDLSKVPETRNMILLGCRVFRGKLRMQSFKKVREPFVRLTTVDGKEVLCSTDLSESQYGKYRGFLFGYLQRIGMVWQFNLLNKGYLIDDINLIIKQFEEDI